MLKNLLLILLLSITFLSCSKKDEEILIGKWQSDRDYFDFKKDQTYSSGRDDVQMVSNFKYHIDPKSHELNLYTDDKNSTYYLIYEFKGKDTLSVRNALSTNKRMIDFIRVKNDAK